MTKGRQGVASQPMEGRTFGRLLCTHERHHRNEQNNWFGLFLCACGTTIERRLADVRRSKNPSCGCLQAELSSVAHTTHGQHDTPAYRSWQQMKNRCLNPAADNFADYGGRGIRVCQRWLDSFESFHDDMGDRPLGTTLDRIEVNGDYSAENCRWAPAKQQCRNKRNNRRYEWQGRGWAVIELAEAYGLSHTTLTARLNRGWSLETSLVTPVTQRKTKCGG